MGKNNCLLYLTGIMPDQDLKNFFAAMCNAINYDERQAYGLACIYAGFGVLAKEPIQESEMPKLMKSNKCVSCTKLVKREKYASYDIIHNACELCSLSEHYRNARLTQELTVLHGILHTGDYSLPSLLLLSTAFNSVLRMSSDTALGNHPVLPFHEQLLLFLQTHPDTKFTKESLLAVFLPEIQTYALSSSTPYQDEEAFVNAVSVYIEDIYHTPIPTPDELKIAIDSLGTEYTYTPIKNVKEVASGTPIKRKPSERIKKKTSEDVEQNNSITTINLFNLPAEQSTVWDVIPDKEVQKEVEPTPIAADSHEDITNNSSDNAGDNVFNNDDTMTDKADKDIIESVSSPTDITEKPIPPKRKRTSVKCNNVCYLGQTIKRLSPAFIRKIIPVRSNNIDHFVRVLLSAPWVGVEKAYIDRRHGLLLYVPGDNNFYFYDASVYGTFTLQEYLFRENKLVLSCHALDPGSYLYLHGYECNGLYSLDSLLHLTGGKTDFTKTVELLLDSLGTEKPRDASLLAILMPQYESIYLKAKTILEEQGRWEEYLKVNRFYSHLYHVYDLSYLVEDLCHGFEELDFLDIKYLFSFNQKPKTPGVLYQFQTTEMSVSSTLVYDSFEFEACQLLQELPYSYQRKAAFLGKYQNMLYVFFAGTLEETGPMQELFLERLRKHYRTRFDDVLHCSVRCVVYE